MPAGHSAIDGAGWVQESVNQAPLTEAGQVFRVDTRHAGHPDGAAGWPTRPRCSTRRHHLAGGRGGGRPPGVRRPAPALRPRAGR
ncbi:hypothetical protein ACFQ0B_28905 [Nonomuraea thailandensis]